MGALPEPFGPHDPFKHARKSGGMIFAAVSAVQALNRGDERYALETLRSAIEENDAFWADFLWPRQPSDEREASWSRAKEYAERNPL